MRPYDRERCIDPYRRRVNRAVSGPERDQRGCLLELSWGGAEPLTLPDGSVRSFLEDGDEVTIGATAPGADGARIGFGEVTGQIQPAAHP
jgi:fumarylacetoacetase